MEQSLEQIAERIIVCGFSEMEDHLNSGEVGAIVTACKSAQCEEDTRQLIDSAIQAGASHHQSLVFEYYGELHNAFGLTKDQARAEDLTPDEWKVKIKAFYKQSTEETISFVDKFFAENSDQKIIIHCAKGSDRSAILTVAYLLKTQGEKASIDGTLRALHQIRPGARLDKVTPFLEAHFGANYEVYATAINEYRRTNSDNHEIRAQLQLEIRGNISGFKCLKHVFDDIKNSAAKNKADEDLDPLAGVRAYLTHVSNSNRFKILMPTW